MSTSSIMTKIVCGERPAKFQAKLCTRRVAQLARYFEVGRMGGWSIENTLVKIRIGTTAGGVATFLSFPMAKQHPRGGGGSSIFIVED